MKLAATLALLTISSLAAASEAEQPVTPPRWSVGAGVSFDFFGETPIALLGVATPTVPVVEASLERRVGAASWLVLGLAALHTSSDADPADRSAFSTSDDARQTSGRVSVGLRRELRGTGTPLVLSALVLANVGGVYDDRAVQPPPLLAEERLVTRGVVAGVSGGFAVDRELTRGLAVRISTTLASISWTWARTTQTGGAPTRHTRSFDAGLFLVPSLELRLAF